MEDKDRIIQIKEEAKKCLNCKNKPCSNNGCPLHNDIPSVIKYVLEDNIEEAYKIICKTNVMPSISGRICPHDKQCSGKCARGIKSEPVGTGMIEAFVRRYGY